MELGGLFSLTKIQTRTAGMTVWRDDHYSSTGSQLLKIEALFSKNTHINQLKDLLGYL